MASVPEGWSEVDPFLALPWRAEVGARLSTDWTPPFRAGARDRAGLTVSGGWRPAPQVWLDSRVEALCDWHPSGTRVCGPGDLELGTTARLPWPAPHEAVALAVGWRVKLPNASDESGLGTDETDVTILAAVGVDLGAARAALVGGLAILGDPLYYAAQDDVPFIEANVALREPPARVILPRPALGSGLAFGTGRNPPRASSWVDLSWGRRVQARIRLGAGWTAASPALEGGLALGCQPPG